MRKSIINVTIHKNLSYCFIFSATIPVAHGGILEAPLKGIQILFIICALMFLTLLLLGLGVSYYCLRRRTIPVVRRLPMSMGSGSEITKLSGSSLGNISAFEGLKIPRVHAPLALVPSSSSSDGPLISDTLPSDYPSESHSEIEEVDNRSLPVSSTGSYENRAYLQEASSIYSGDNMGYVQEIQAVAMRTPSPKFDVQVRLKRAPPSPPARSRGCRVARLMRPRPRAALSRASRRGSRSRRAPSRGPCGARG